jgi:hypothetical protein
MKGKSNLFLLRGIGVKGDSPLTSPAERGLTHLDSLKGEKGDISRGQFAQR